MNILVIDDEKSIRFSLKLMLSKLENTIVFDAKSGEEGLEILKSNNIDLAIIDIKLPGIDGIEVLKQINRLKFSTLVIMITYLSEVRLAVKAMKMGAHDYYTKPFSLEEIKKEIINIMELINIKRKVSEKSSDISGLVGQSEEITRIKHIIDKITSKGLKTNVLITGESGTGKEVVANLIHKKMHENKPLVALNCAAIPKSLQESELFGYEKGAFTEAKNKKVGLIEKSNGGTLFLDEIGDMDLSLQSKLLRVIEQRKYRRIGGTENISFDSTIIAATNKDLKEEIKFGSFRKDLFYRLNVMPIHIPPLRDRKDDIPYLIDYFIENYNKKTNEKITGISKEALDALCEYRWHGNVRELKNIIERMAILNNNINNKIKYSDLPKDIFETENKYENSNLYEAEKKAIFISLKKNNYNITHTANDLGITRTTLRNKMKKYEINKD